MLLYHAAGENQRFSCLWSFLWSGPLFGPVWSSNKIPQAAVLQSLVALGVSGRGWRGSHTQIKRDTTFATPGYSVFAIIPRARRKSKIFLSVVIPVVKAAFRPGFSFRRNPATRRVPKPCGLQYFESWMAREPLPKQARYQLRYTRVSYYSFLHPPVPCALQPNKFGTKSLCAASRLHRLSNCATPGFCFVSIIYSANDCNYSFPVVR